MHKIDIENAPGFLVGRVAHQLKTHVRRFIKEAGLELTAEELTILTALAHLESEKSMGSLAEMLGRDATTLKRQLNSLVKLSLVERKCSPEDRRVILISITKKGETLVDSTMPLTLDLRERAMKNISESDRQILIRVLSQMRTNLIER